MLLFWSIIAWNRKKFALHLGNNMDDEGEATVMGENEGDTFFDNRELPPNQANPTPSNVYDTLTQGLFNLSGLLLFPFCTWI